MALRVKIAAVAISMAFVLTFLELWAHFVHLLYGV